MVYFESKISFPCELLLLKAKGTENKAKFSGSWMFVYVNFVAVG